MKCRAPSRGFSLVELLVVIAIIVILTVVALPAMRGIAAGTGLTQAVEDMVAVFNLARQRASTFNRQVAIRFWKDGENYASYQLWEQKDAADPASWTAIERERALPVGVIVTNSATYSPLLARLGATGTTNSRSYADVLFTPAGSVVATTNEIAVTLIQSAGPKSGGVISGLPPNFGTVVIDPFNGVPRIYRP